MEKCFKENALNRQTMISHLNTNGSINFEIMLHVKELIKNLMAWRRLKQSSDNIMRFDIEDN